MAFHFGKKKQVEKVEVPPTQEADREVKEVVTVEKEKVNLSDPQARLQYVKRLHEGILEADKQCENFLSERYPDFGSGTGRRKEDLESSGFQDCRPYEGTGRTAEEKVQDHQCTGEGTGAV